MKKAIFPALVLAATMVAGQAWAGVIGSAHDITASTTGLAAFGACAACHIPHKAVGNRLWPAPINGTNAARGDVGNLCTYCHDGTNGVVDEAKQFKVFKDTVQGALTHGMVKDNAPEGRLTLDPALPYCTDAAGDNIQCTSCHNVHEQLHGTPASGQLAFLISDVDGLCARCHTARQFAAGAATTLEAAWGANLGFNQATPANGNPGSHPVGTDVVGDSDTPANSPIVIDAALGLVNGGISTAYVLGAKAIGGQQADISTGMGCVTCHMVHGSDTANPVEDLLAIDQVSSPANGNGEVNNALCEACHQGPAPGAYGGGLFPNPGAGAGTHPVDNYYNATTAFTITIPAGWATGDGGQNGTEDIICESCHMPHPLAAMANPNQVDPLGGGTNSHILRAADLNICDSCHVAGSMANHHPVGAGLMVAGTFVDANIGDQDVDMECSDCHNGAGAHNWTGEWRVGLDPEWIPADNARATDTEAARFNAGTSTECIICHTNNGGRFSPTLPNVAGEYQNAGDASHFIGLRPVDGANVWDWGGLAINPDGNQGGTGGNFITSPWDNGAWSRFGGTGDADLEFVCESCHDIEPDKNLGNNALLLANFTENIVESRSTLCEGCHSDKGTDTGAPHPMSGDSISKASNTGRATGLLLQTDTTVGYAQKGATGDTTYSNTNWMNCDSCHQAHDAVTESGTYILEGGATLTGAAEGAVTAGGVTWSAQRYTGGEATKLDYQPFCNLCHTSGE